MAGRFQKEKRRHFFDYFQREIAYLRHEGAEFAHTHPKIARRLDFSNVESSDPHVERMLQSFAFLTARLQRDIDDLFPRISNALLETLYPQFLAPLPSYTITKFDISDGSGKLTGGFKVPKSTKLYVNAQDGDVCRFQTTCDLELYPMVVDQVDVVSTIDLPPTLGNFECNRALKVHIKSLAGPLRDLDLNKLRFHIFGDPILQNKFYEALFLDDSQTAIEYDEVEGKTRCQMARLGLCEPVGFSEDEAALPYPDHGHPGYRLLQEYFAYPQKFMFFEVNVKECKAAAEGMTIYLSLSDEVAVDTKDIGVQNIQLNCVPAVNLFQKVSEPIRIDYRNTDYRLLADQRRSDTTEINSIRKVLGSIEGTPETIDYSPYFSYTHAEEDREQARFWHARRNFSSDPNRPGYDVYLSFVDYEFNPAQPISQAVYAELLCTNGPLAATLTPGTELQSDESIPVGRVYCLDRPSPQRYLNRETTSQWRLISHLALGHLSLTDPEASIHMLKELVVQYGDFGDGQAIPELDCLRGFETDRVTRRIGYDAWRGFAHGTLFKVTFSEKPHSDVSEFLFANILNCVFPQFSSINSFTQLEVTRVNRRGNWKRWAPRSGTKTLV